MRSGIRNRVNRQNIQEACPWNSPKLEQVTTERDYLPRVPRLSGYESEPEPEPGMRTHPHTHTGPSTASPSLVEPMRMTREEWDLWTRGSAIRDDPATSPRRTP